MKTKILCMCAILIAMITPAMGADIGLGDFLPDDPIGILKEIGILNHLIIIVLVFCVFVVGILLFLLACCIIKWISSRRNEDYKGQTYALRGIGCIIISIIVVVCIILIIIFGISQTW